MATKINNTIVDEVNGIVNAKVVNRGIEKERRCADRRDCTNHRGNYAASNRGKKNGDQIENRDRSDIHKLLQRNQCCGQ